MKRLSRMAIAAIAAAAETSTVVAVTTEDSAIGVMRFATETWPCTTARTKARAK